MEDIRVRLSVLWLFAMLNYIYADVFFCIDVLGSNKGGPSVIHFSPRSVVRSRNTHGDPDGDDSAVADPEAQSKSLGEHRRGHNRNCRCSLDHFHVSNL